MNNDGSVTPSVDEGQIVSNPISKNQLRKQRNYDKKLELRKVKRTKERKQRKSKPRDPKFGNLEKLVLRDKLKEGLRSGPKVIIDCQYDEHMSVKEQKRLAQQIRRAYSSNKSSTKPLHLCLTALSEQSDFFRICTQQNSGFADYIIERTAQTILEKYPSQDIVYLSPDSKCTLTTLDPSKVYVIGGLVDETTNKNISHQFCEQNKIQTAKLPIDDYFETSKTTFGTLKKILTVNQVFDILLNWYETSDWVKAISVGLPERTGLVPKTVKL